jgi:hypothetical protein
MISTSVTAAARKWIRDACLNFKKVCPSFFVVPAGSEKLIHPPFVSPEPFDEGRPSLLLLVERFR